MLLHYLTNESKQLSRKIQQLQKQLKELPKGKLLCSKNGKYEKCFHYYDKQLHYIKNTDFNLTLKLAEKKFLLALLEDLSYKQKILDTYLNQLNTYQDTTTELLNQSSKYRKYIIESLHSFSSPLPDYTDLPSSDYVSLDSSFEIQTKIDEWKKESYLQNSNYPEALIHTTYSGYKVRSKSEAIIDTALLFNKIPFRYECALPISDTIYYPDFTIMHPKTGKLFYWEHFGKIDNPMYFQNNITKLNVFANHGIVPSINLIITSETSKIPFSIDIAERIIHEYFL